MIISAWPEVCEASMEDTSKQSIRSYDTGYSGSLRDRAAVVNYNNRPEEARQERLHFDMDTGRLMVNNPPEEQPALPDRGPVPDRPVLDKMASQGFFLD